MDSKATKRLEEFERAFSAKEVFHRLQGVDLLSAASKFKRIEKLYREKHADRLVAKRIAVLASFTSHHLIEALRLTLYQHGIAPEFYEGEYDGIIMELLNPDSGLFSFKPEIVLILPKDSDYRDIPALFSSAEDLDSWINKTHDHYQGLWSQLKLLSGCQIVHVLPALPIRRQLGVLESNYTFSRSNCIKMLHLKLMGNRPPNVNFIDFDYLSSLVGKLQWIDEKNYFLSKQGISIDLIHMASFPIARLIESIAGKAKKALVLDLDNTLWGGVIGDDGLEGIVLDPNNAIGEAFIVFQEYVLSLKERGVILAVCSKNDLDIAKQPFTSHSSMVLKLEDISCFVANWNDKTSNIREIAKQLNIGVDALVFFDDNPAERDIVRRFVPEVEVVEVPEDPAEYVRALELSMCFDWAGLSTEDLGRTETYVANEKRITLEASSLDYDSYLESLEMTGRVSPVSEAELSRFSQLINKSNQFNLRTQRYTQSALMSMMQDKAGYTLLCVELSDRFSKYGLISCLILRHEGDIAFIDTWVMSCRVLKRGVESMAFNVLVKRAMELGSKWLVGEYISTPKNKLVSSHYPDLEFQSAPPDWYKGADSSEIYRLGLPAENKLHLIEDYDKH